MLLLFDAAFPDKNDSALPKMPTEALWKLFTLGLESSGTPFNIAESDEVKHFSRQSLARFRHLLPSMTDMASKLRRKYSKTYVFLPCSSF